MGYLLEGQPPPTPEEIRAFVGAGFVLLSAGFLYIAGLVKEYKDKHPKTPPAKKIKKSSR